MNKNSITFKNYKNKKNSFTNIHAPRKFNINQSPKNTTENCLKIVSKLQR